MRNAVIISLCAALLGTGVTYAAEPYLPRQERGFKKVDINGDGKIARDEFSKITQKSFARMDTNGDSQVTVEELDKTMLAAVAKRRDRIMKFLDNDKNGIIIQAELDKIVEAMFNGADTDHDGTVTLTEAQGFKRGVWRQAILEKGVN
jgi:Ca2+-binding EF-hand superfamily protein